MYHKKFELCLPVLKVNTTAIITIELVLCAGIEAQKLQATTGAVRV
jgi:hypothetical protein